MIYIGRNQVRRSNVSGDGQPFVPVPTSQQHVGILNRHYEYAQEAEAAAHATVEKAKNDRPKNTTKSYRSKQIEFIEWCHENCPPGPLNEIVDDRKLHYFLVSKVSHIHYM